MMLILNMKNGQIYILSSMLLLILAFAEQTHAQSSRFSLLPQEKKVISANTVTTSKIFPKNPLIKQIVAPIPKAYCYDDLAIFCKLEVKLEKTFKFPVKIRLGEVNYVEMLEGKPYSPWTW